MYSCKNLHPLFSYLGNLFQEEFQPVTIVSATCGSVLFI